MTGMRTLIAALAMAAFLPAQMDTLYPLPKGWRVTRDGLKTSERARHGMVASPDEIASRVGVEVLRNGGNAVDAAVAVGFALAVTFPEAGNIGGGGMMLVHLAGGESHAVDYREMTPQAARPALFERYLDRWFGYRSLGIPGTVAGLGTAHARWGSRPWADRLEPARRLAAEGHPLSQRMAETISFVALRMKEHPEAAKVFLDPDGRPWEQGHPLRQPDLARTIAVLREEGWESFYRGSIGRRMVAGIRENGGLITEDDWSAYQARVLEPLRGSYRGLPVVTMPAPATSGGVALLEMLNLRELFPASAEAAGSASAWHLAIEIMRRADYDRRRWYGDKGLPPAEPETLVAKDYAKSVAQLIRADSATPSSALSAGGAPPGSQQTTSYTIVDQHGNIVSNTYTLQGALGALVMPGGTGVLLCSGASYFDIGAGNRNEIGPRKRPIYSMTPTLVARKDGSPWFALGSPGGYTIANTLFQVIVGMVDYGMGLRDTVEAPRLSQGYKPDEVSVERGALSAETVEKLRAMGHSKFYFRRGALGDVQAVMIDESGWRYGWSDGRAGGRALGY